MNIKKYEFKGDLTKDKPSAIIDLFDRLYLLQIKIDEIIDFLNLLSIDPISGIIRGNLFDGSKTLTKDQKD